MLLGGDADTKANALQAVAGIIKNAGQFNVLGGEGQNLQNPQLTLLAEKLKEAMAAGKMSKDQADKIFATAAAGSETGVGGATGSVFLRRRMTRAPTRVVTPRPLESTGPSLSPSGLAVRRVVVWVLLSLSMRSLVDMRFLFRSWIL